MPIRMVVALVVALAAAGACSGGTPSSDSSEPAAESTPDAPGTSSTTHVSATSEGGSTPATQPVPATEPSPVEFVGTSQEIDDTTAQRMASSWREGCPVPLADLRLLTLDHWGYDAQVHAGELIVHADVAEDVVEVFSQLFTARFPIERMELVDLYAGDDDASMAANNTSAFNCRSATGSDRWSEHAYGRAVDVNPAVNPYVSGEYVAPPEAAGYLTRDASVPGLIVDGDAVVGAFASIGWSWGGHWTSPKDYQHFSATGR